MIYSVDGAIQCLSGPYLFGNQSYGVHLHGDVMLLPSESLIFCFLFFFFVFLCKFKFLFIILPILGDPEADKGGEGKSKRAEKYIWNEEK